MTTTDLTSHADAIDQLTYARNGYVECHACNRSANCANYDWDYEEAWTRVDHQRYCVVRLNADLQAKVERLEARLARGEAWCNTHDFGKTHPQVLELRKALAADGGEA